MSYHICWTCKHSEKERDEEPCYNCKINYETLNLKSKWESR
jgi:hypothetical protein